MAMKVRQNGVWKQISFPSGKIGIVNTFIPAGRALGDVNGDGEVNYVDAVLTLQAILYEETSGEKGTPMTSPIARRAANVHNNASDTLTEDDAQAMTQVGVGIFDNYVGKDVSDDPKWFWDEAKQKYYYPIEMFGITPDFSTIVLLKSAQENLFYGVECVQNSIKIFAQFIPTTDVQASIIYAPSGGQGALYFISNLTDTQVEDFIKEEIDALPIKTAQDGYTDISNLRQVTKINVTREGQDIQIEYSLQGLGETIKDTIHLDDNDFPISGESNNVPWTATWVGF